LAKAEAIGRLVARAGAVLYCGGLGGAMAAACRGAQRAGGITVGILPGYDASDANPWVTHPVCTGMGQARNVILVASVDVVIACGGGWGTLSEIAHAARLDKPVVVLGRWSPIGDLAGPGSSPRVIHVATTPEECVTKAVELSQRRR
jgi:uncharacterized protein (TIGR00725 family)